MKEVIEMAQALLEMKPDTYMKCKYILLAVSREHEGTKAFVRELFNFTDRKRPLLIEMKKGE